jgi:electron transport complex protein RnfD
MDQEKERKLLSISVSPHIRSDEDTRSIMLDVLIALVPALGVAAYMFGFRAILVTLVSCIACVFFEWAYRKLLKKPNSVGDLSAVVTGTLLAYCLPVTVPIGVLIVGDFFAIIIVKQLFGGLGKNFMNPALAGRVFLFSWPVVMNTWVTPLSYSGFFNVSTADAVTSATPLSVMAGGTLPAGTTLLQCFLGQVGGSLGEVSAFALLLGAVYLLIRRVITLHIPLSFLLTVAVLSFLFPQGNPRLLWTGWQLCSGGLILGACFMANDYVTSPVSPRAQIVYGIGCGLLTVFIRRFGAYAEGVSYAILIMNATVWLLDKAFPNKRFGAVKEKKEKEAAK